MVAKHRIACKLGFRRGHEPLAFRYVMHIVKRVTPTFLEKRNKQPGIEVLRKGFCESCDFTGEVATQR